MQLIDGSLKLWVFGNVLLKYRLIMGCNGNWEISGLRVPVCLTLRGYQEFYKLPYGCLLVSVLIVQSP